VDVASVTGMLLRRDSTIFAIMSFFVRNLPLAPWYCGIRNHRTARIWFNLL
jgi:hypothetical protein